MGSSASKPAVIPIVENEKRTLAMLSTDMASLDISSAPKSTNGALTLSNVASWESAISSDPKSQLARTILSHSDIRSALQSRAAHTADVHVFNTEVDFKTLPITNQKSSGRCWIFATTNILRYDIMKKLKLKEFQLSQV
jgi:bleomycin hydrolase